MDEKQKKVETSSSNEKNLSHLDPRTFECENKVQHIIHLQAIANRLLNALNDVVKVTKSYIPVVNSPSRIVVPENYAEMDQNGPHLKHGRLIRLKDIVLLKQRGRNQEFIPKELVTPKEA